MKWGDRSSVRRMVRDEPVTAGEEWALKRVCFFVWGLACGVGAVIATGALTVWLLGWR